MRREILGMKMRVSFHWPNDWFPWTGIDAGKGFVWIDLVFMLITGWK